MANAISSRANSVLPMPTSQSNADTPAATKSSKSKTPIEGDKVVIRRLPPGLTLEEFWGHLGEEWKPGSGLVDWFDFKKGKISQDPAKLSRPGRAYLHVLKRDYLADLSTTVQSKTWEDAKATYNNPCLVGPPALELSIYKRFPGNKKRNDQRQGTIDQDPEFMAYLLSLTNPEPERDAHDDKAGEEIDADVKVTTTPLIEYLKEKKANKAKEAALAKSAKHGRQESQGAKSKGSTMNADEPKRSKKDKDSKSSKSAEKPKDPVKILTKKAANAEAGKASESAATQTAAAQEAPKSRRANIAAAARILQRDLGLSPGSAHRRARLNAAKSEAEAKTTTTKEPAAEPAAAPAPTPASNPSAAPAPTTAQPTERPPTPAATRSGRSRRGGGGKNANEPKSKNSEAKEAPVSNPASAPAPAKPVVLLKKRDNKETKDNNAAPSPATQNAASASAEAPPSAKSSTAAPASKSSGGKASSGAKKASGGSAITPGATRGFVKHANPSQGVTEALLKQALQTFGAVTFVEIDRRKGFAYVDFAEHESLAKAINSSPVSVAQGAVQILERKEKKTPVPAAAPATAAPAEKTEQQSGSRRNRRGRGGKGGGGDGAKDGKDGKDGGRAAAGAKAAGGG